MKRFAMLVVVCLLALVFNVLTSQQVSARPEYKGRLEEATKKSKAADAIKEQKCNVCHYGKSKKNRNDFGKAVNKGITEENYKELKGDEEKLEKCIDAAISGALKEKGADGKTFGDLIEAGQLPAKNPE